MQLFTALLLALGLASSTTASPIVDAATIKRSEDIVVMAQITEPAQGVIWRVGSEQPVAWNKSTIPPQADTETASILLGYFDSDGLDHVDFDSPLAEGFLLETGSQNVTVPDVTPGSSYFVTLFGDTGDISQTFTITR